MNTPTLSGKQLDELADELRDRTCDFINEELWEYLIELGLVEETTDDAIELHNQVLRHYYHANLTKDWE